MGNIHSYQWKQIRKRVLSRDGNTCTWCGNSEGKMEVDHIQPRFLGGGDDMSNLQTLCQPCHIRKTKNDSVFLTQEATPPYHVHYLSPKGTMKTVDGVFV